MKKIFSAALIGLETKTIEIEAEVSSGLRHFQIIGLPDKAIQEAAQRVGIALKNSGFPSPFNLPQKVVISLAPADLKKEGSLYDLPIAISYLLASGNLYCSPEKKLFLGELSLEGKLKRIKGAILFAFHAKKENFSEIILPKENAKEAAIVKGIKVLGMNDLKEVVGYLKNEIKISPENFEFEKESLEEEEIPLNEIYGQDVAKEALQICAAGGHHLFFLGPPGVGKSLLAKSVCSILPPLDFEESLEITKIYSLAGLLPSDKPLIQKRPFRSPHHTISEVALLGGGNPPMPGEITLAHKGVLFLDEFPEFHRDVLESLRQPLEEGRITIMRSKYRVSFPAQFTLIAASNPCPCGYYGDEEVLCKCQYSQIKKYQRKLSGPLIDRIDLFVTVPRIKFEKIERKNQDFDVNKIREKILRAKEIQKERFKNEKISSNSQMGIKEIKKYCQIDERSKNLLKKSIDCGEISIRGYHKILKVARTISDLENEEKISFESVARALFFRKREI